MGTLAYAGLILILRLSGKRTLSKMNAFDLVVTVALGSTLATVLLSKGVDLVEGLTAFLLLVLLQWVITRSSVHSRRFESLIKASPRLLSHRGEVFHKALLAERMTEEELRAGIRQAGLADLSQTLAVILETDGSLSVIPARQGDAACGALKGLSKAEKDSARANV